MAWFKFNWFRSKERAELLALQIEGQEMQNAKLGVELKDIFDELEAPKRPYKKIIYSNENITVILPGNVEITKDKVSVDVFELVKDATTEAEIRDLLLDRRKDIASPTAEPEYTLEELGFVEDGKNSLRNNEDFEFKGPDVYLKGVNLAIPPIILAGFIELEEKFSLLSVSEEDDEAFDELENKFEALKMFWKWTAMNPIQSSRNDLYSFIKKNDINISSDGLLEMYRRVIKVGDIDKSLVDFISASYTKVKKAKKGPKNYSIYQAEDKSYYLDKNIKVKEDVFIGNLEELYLDLPNRKENIYTDAHTRTKEIRVGSVYQEDEDKIDLDNGTACGAGLHVGSRSFMFDGFGDTGVLALVNPMKVRSVPYYEANKMRVSEMFIASVMDIEEYKNSIDEGDLVDYSKEYFGISVNELEEQLRTKNYDALACKDFSPAVSVVDMEGITASLKARIVSI